MFLCSWSKISRSSSQIFVFNDQYRPPGRHPAWDSVLLEAKVRLFGYPLFCRVKALLSKISGDHQAKEISSLKFFVICCSTVSIVIFNIFLFLNVMQLIFPVLLNTLPPHFTPEFPALLCIRCDETAFFNPFQYQFFENVF